MTTIDHAAEARKLLEDTAPFQGQHLEVAMTSAQVYATLALVDAHREANEQARIANLIAYVAHSDGMPQGHKEWIEEELGL